MFTHIRGLWVGGDTVQDSENRTASWTIGCGSELCEREAQERLTGGLEGHVFVLLDLEW
jgi:hypothetical protein